MANRNYKLVAGLLEVGAIRAVMGGIVHYEDLIPGKSLRSTALGMTVRRWGRKRYERLWPRIIICDENDKYVDLHYLRDGARPLVFDGQRVEPGDMLADYDLEGHELHCERLKRQNAGLQARLLELQELVAELQRK